MTVKEVINTLLNSNCSLDSNIVILKELDYNVWVNADLKIKSIEPDYIICDFDFPTEKFEIKRKKVK